MQQITLSQDWHVSDSINLDKSLRRIGYNPADASSLAYRLDGKITSEDMLGVIQRSGARANTLINDLASVCKIRSTTRFLQIAKTPVHDVTDEITLAAACDNSIDLPYQTPIYASSAVGLKHLHDVFGDFLSTQNVNKATGNGILCRPEQRSRVVTHAELVDMGYILKPQVQETAFAHLARTSMHKTPDVWASRLASRAQAGGIPVAETELEHLAKRYGLGFASLVRSKI